jgi:hypothetical protein
MIGRSIMSSMNHRDDYLSDKSQYVVTDRYRQYQPQVQPQSTMLYCRNAKDCGKTVETHNGLIPPEWYAVKRVSAQDGLLKTVAIICSLECLIKDATNVLAQRANARGDRY